MTPGSPKRFEDTHHRDPFAHLRSHRSSTDHDNFIQYRDDGTPDSPISQVNLLTNSRFLNQPFSLLTLFCVFFSFQMNIFSKQS